MKTVKNNRGISLVVVLMIMVLLLSITGAGLLFSGTGLRTAGAYRTGTQALYAADTGINVSIGQLQLNAAAAQAPIAAATLAYGTGYHGGRRDGSDPGPVPNGPARIRPWFSTQHSFIPYQINVTGTGPTGATREIEAQAEYGPVPVSSPQY